MYFDDILKAARIRSLTFYLLIVLHLAVQLKHKALQRESSLFEY